MMAEYVTTRKRVQNALDEVWLTKGHGVLATAISTAKCTACANAFPYPAQAFGALRAGWIGARRLGAGRLWAAPTAMAEKS